MSLLEQSIAEKLLAAREDGSPVAPADGERARQMATVARRRLNSFARRHANVADTTIARIDDLARGLAENFEVGEWSHVGPLIEDYRWLAAQLAPLLTTGNETNP
jgi:hypothetical protein